ncbi:MAG: hypothetical protein RL154_324 [Pseudomonadota bacterium]|jgi:diguanylate cyclase (GGDEF)-like protein/PAS domain S-box-containing protein
MGFDMAALATTDDLLSAIASNTNDALWITDLSERYLFVNEAMCKNILIAENLEEPIGKTSSYFTNRTKHLNPTSNWHTLCSLSNEQNCIVLNDRKPTKLLQSGYLQGTLVDVEINKAPFCDSNGNLIGIIGVCKDITHKKTLENELNNATKLIEGGPVVVFSWSGEDGWPVKYVSQNVENLLGLSADNFKTESIKFSDFIFKDDIERVTKEVSDYISMQSASFYQEYRLLTKTNKIVWVEDFTIIDYDSSGVPVNINGYLIDITQKKLTEQQNLRFANFDTLTGLPNRQKLQTDMQKQTVFACVILNIDSFKEINDLFGIFSGDEILQQIANWFCAVGLEPYRIDGDEFAFLFNNAITKNALEGRVLAIIALFEDQLFRIGKEMVNLRMSAGIAISEEDLLTKADIALHIAKERKIQHCFYEETENIEDKYRKNIALATKIRKALVDERIICHYQPIVDFVSNVPCKYEALVRAIDRHGNIIPPNEFLSVAKKTKLYPKITKEVMKQSCLLFATRTEEFSVNLSISDIEDTQTVKDIIDIITQTNTANRIVFELLESERIQNYEAVAKFIADVKELGAKIAIDDFGTGYSNFEHILNLNVDYIKIDGSLIRGIANNYRHRIIVETIVDFAKKINAKTIAEYVSDEEIYNVVKALGVDYSQGYYTGKPEPLE